MIEYFLTRLAYILPFLNDSAIQRAALDLKVFLSHLPLIISSSNSISIRGLQLYTPIV